jgi:hypothetical protein
LLVVRNVSYLQEIGVHLLEERIVIAFVAARLALVLAGLGVDEKVAVLITEWAITDLLLTG